MFVWLNSRCRYLRFEFDDKGVLRHIHTPNQLFVGIIKSEALFSIFFPKKLLKQLIELQQVNSLKN
jgi:hypothetical protein